MADNSESHSLTKGEKWECYSRTASLLARGEIDQADIADLRPAIQVAVLADQRKLAVEFLSEIDRREKGVAA